MVKNVTVSGAAEGKRSSTGVTPEIKRWSANRKKEDVLRLMRGEPVDALSRELGIEIYCLEEKSGGAYGSSKESKSAASGYCVTCVRTINICCFS